MNGEVEIVIKKDGTISFEVAGVAGTRCEDLTEALIRNVGTVQQQEFTEEYCQERPDYINVNEE